MSMFEDCFKGRRAAFGNKRRALVNLHDMGVDIYEPAGVPCIWLAIVLMLMRVQYVRLMARCNCR